MARRLRRCVFYTSLGGVVTWRAKARTRDHHPAICGSTVAHGNWFKIIGPMLILIALILARLLIPAHPLAHAFGGAPARTSEGRIP